MAENPTAILPPPIRLIASTLDHPSVFMGGPSRQSIRTAQRIWAVLVGAKLVKETDDGTI